MFSSLTSYLFGSPSDIDIAEAEMPKNELKPVEECDIADSDSEGSFDGSVSGDSTSSESRIEKPDDWVLITDPTQISASGCKNSQELVRTSKSTMTQTVDSSASGSAYCGDELMVTGSYWEHGSDDEAALSDVSSVPEIVAHPSINESWLMTPPPVSHVGSHAAPAPADPFDSLLLERQGHSVHQPRMQAADAGSGQLSDSSDDDDTEQGRDEPVYERIDHTQKRKVAPTPSSSTHSTLSAKQQVIAAKKAHRSMQAASKQRQHKQLSKAQLQRNNKVAQKHCNKPFRRKDQISRRPNGAVYDRKSQ